MTHLRPGRLAMMASPVDILCLDFSDRRARDYGSDLRLSVAMNGPSTAPGCGNDDFPFRLDMKGRAR